MVKHIIAITGFLLSISSVATTFDYDVESIWDKKSNLNVIHDSGQSVPINDYYRKGENLPSDESRKNTLREEVIKTLRKMKTPDDNVIAAIQKGHFPIEPEVIKLSNFGVSKERAIPNIQENIFVIGSDEYSLMWAVNNKEELLKRNPIGIVTKVVSLEQLKEIHQLLKPLRLMPINADFISEHFDVWTYPVLITKKGEFR